VQALVMTTDRRPLLLMSPALLVADRDFMLIPCALILVLAFFRRGIYGGIEYTLDTGKHPLWSLIRCIFRSF
jgi:hypothetical protein